MGLCTTSPHNATPSAAVCHFFSRGSGRVDAQESAHRFGWWAANARNSRPHLGLRTLARPQVERAAAEVGIVGRETPNWQPPPLPPPPEVVRAMELLPRGVFLLTAAFETKRAGQIVHWVQPCATEPALVCVAARNGHAVEPLIRDSHVFAVCRVDPEDRLLIRKFSPTRTPDDSGDPFDSFETERMATGAPVLKRASVVLDCEVVRHFDLEANHELYIGIVRAARCEVR